MKSKVEVDYFPDGRLMLRIHFSQDSNFWIEGREQATWVPTLKEVDLLKEALEAINEYNEIKRVNHFEQKNRYP